VEKTQLCQGNIIALGQQNVFRFHHPAEAERLRHSTPKEKRKQRVFTPDISSLNSSNDDLLKEEKKRLEEKLQLERNRVQEEMHQLNSSLQAEREALEEQKVKYSTLMEEEKKRLQQLKEEVTEKETQLREHQEKILEHEQTLHNLGTSSPQLSTEKQQVQTQLIDPQTINIHDQQQSNTLQPKHLENKEKQPTLEREETHLQLQRRYSSPTRQPNLFRSNMKEYLSTRHDLSQLPQVEVSDDGVCSGFLIKQGEVVKNWKKRFFVFSPSYRTFTYFNDHTQKSMKGIIYFDAIQSIWCDAYDGDASWMHKFYIKTHQRTYNIRAQTHNVMRVWLDILSTTQIEDAEMS
jgi:myosin heavy subunit